MQGPYEFELKVRLTNGEQTAITTCYLPVGVLPTKEGVAALVEESLATVNKQMGGGFRLQTRHEFENEILAERTGVTMTFATKDDWDA